MTINDLGAQAGRVEVNLAPLLLIIGAAMTSPNGPQLDAAIETLFCHLDKL